MFNNAVFIIPERIVNKLIFNTRVHRNDQRVTRGTRRVSWFHLVLKIWIRYIQISGQCDIGYLIAFEDLLLLHVFRILFGGWGSSFLKFL